MNRRCIALSVSVELVRCGNDEITNRDGLLVCGRTRGDYEDRGPSRPGQGGNNGGGWGGNNGGGWGNNRTPQGSYPADHPCW